MHNTRFYIKIIICAAFMLSCFHNNPDTEVSPDIYTEDTLKKENVGDNDLSKDLNVEKKFFIHINTTNPALLEDSDQRKKINEEGWEVSYDGMEVNL